MTQHQRGTHGQAGTPGADHDRPLAPRGCPSVLEPDGERAALVADLVEVGVDNLCTWVPRLSDPLDAEMLASDVCGRWGVGGRTGDHELRVAVALIESLVERDDGPALAGLRALACGGSDAVARLAGRAAEHLADSGLVDPPWWAARQTFRSTRAGLLVSPDDRSAEVVLIEFAWSGGPRHCIAAVIAHARGGVATSLDLTQDAETLGRCCAEEEPELDIGLLPLSVGEARTRIVHAMRRSETIGDPWRRDSYRWYRGLVQRRLELVGHELRRRPGAAARPPAGTGQWRRAA